MYPSYPYRIRLFSKSGLSRFFEEIDSYQQIYSGNSAIVSKTREFLSNISLRITGESAAIQIKNYIESHSYLENTDIILLVISDHEYLLRKVNQIQKNKGLCVR